MKDLPILGHIVLVVIATTIVQDGLPVSQTAVDRVFGTNKCNNNNHQAGSRAWVSWEAQDSRFPMSFHHH